MLRWAVGLVLGEGSGDEDLRRAALRGRRAGAVGVGGAHRLGRQQDALHQQQTGGAGALPQFRRRHLLLGHSHRTLLVVWNLKRPQKGLNLACATSQQRLRRGKSVWLIDSYATGNAGGSNKLHMPDNAGAIEASIRS